MHPVVQNGKTLFAPDGTKMWLFRASAATECAPTCRTLVGPRGDRWNIKRRHQLQHFLVLCVDHTEKRGALGVGGRSKVERPQQTGRPGDEFHLCVICQVLPKREVPATRIAAPEPLASEEPAVPCCRRRSAAESELDTHLRGSSVSAPI